VAGRPAAALPKSLQLTRWLVQLATNPLLCLTSDHNQLVVATSMEPAKWQPGGEAQAACEEDGTKTTWMQEETQRHGFMMRGDTSNTETLAAIRKYMAVMFTFFEENI